jgi:hypothetical protein
MTDLEQQELLTRDIAKCIRILSEKFRKWPYNFFTESDAHSYLYYSFFRYGIPELKAMYPTKTPRIKPVLIHREYPTFFRYEQKNLIRYLLHEPVGTVGHYDMVVLNPEFMENHSIEQVISKDNTVRQTVAYEKDHLLTAIEFKLLHKPLSKALRHEIKKDFIKLTWALESKQARQAYMLIFNRYGSEKGYIEELQELESAHPEVKLIYQESYFDGLKHKTFIRSFLT